MENNNNICATQVSYKEFTMCQHCSSMMFKSNGTPYWKCNKYNKILTENQDKFLTKCNECISITNI